MAACSTGCPNKRLGEIENAQVQPFPNVWSIRFAAYHRRFSRRGYVHGSCDKADHPGDRSHQPRKNCARLTPRSSALRYAVIYVFHPPEGVETHRLTGRSGPFWCIIEQMKVIDFVKATVYRHRSDMGIVIAAPYYAGITNSLVGLGAHILFLGFFLQQKVYPMVLFNLFSVAWFVFVSRRAIRTNDPNTYLLGALEVVPHQVLAVIFVGWGAGFQYYLLLVPVMMGLVLSTYKRPIHYVVAAGAAGAFITLFVLRDTFTPIYSLQPAGLVTIVGAVNAGFCLLMLGIFAWVYGFVAERSQTEIEREFNRAEGLLLNILPEPIAARLKDGESPIADRVPSVSVLFLDIVRFTELSSSMDASDLVQLLNQTFGAFDQICDRYWLEKIKTIGDAYMAVGGLTIDDPDHATHTTEAGLDMIEAIVGLAGEHQIPYSARVGICTGPVVAGVIGKRKFIFDLWGDTVNTASRMESHGSVGRVHVSESTASQLSNRLSATERGQIQVKGKGELRTYFVERCDSV